MKVLFIAFSLMLSTFAFQQSFEGEIRYKVDFPEMMLSSIPGPLKDSVKITVKVIKNKNVRTETFSKMGKQILLEKIGSDTSYLLMNLMGTDIALEMINPGGEPKKKDSLVVEGKSEKLFGFKCKKASYTKYGKTHTIFFTTALDKGYGNSFSSLGGLALIFPIVINEKDVLLYSCTSIEEKEISDDQFTIPNNFKITTMEEFGKMIGG
jgi:GLPGLI family protein